MANSIKLETCPQCGATLAANLVKLLKTNPLEYSCPKKVDSRKEWEESWKKDVNVERGLDELFKENLDEVSRNRLVGGEGLDEYGKPLPHGEAS